MDIESLLALLAAGSALIIACITQIQKSRCTEIKCGSFYLKRDLSTREPPPETVVEVE